MATQHANTRRFLQKSRWLVEEKPGLNFKMLHCLNTVLNLWKKPTPIHAYRRTTSGRCLEGNLNGRVVLSLSEVDPTCRHNFTTMFNALINFKTSLILFYTSYSVL